MFINAENVSLIIGISSFIAAIIFFFAARQSEKESMAILFKINNTVETLQKVTNKMLDKAIDNMSSNIKQILTHLLKSNQNEIIPYRESNEDLISLKLSLYSYILKSIFSNQALKIYMAKDGNVFPDLIIDQGIKDCHSIRLDIEKEEPENLKKSPHYKTYLADRKLLIESFGELADNF